MRDRKPDEDFKRWFSSSTVVDARGNPLVLYHGTTVRFANFTKSEDGGFHFGDEAAAGWRLADLTGDEATPGNRIIAVYLSIQHPKLLDFDAGDPDSWRKQIEQAKAEGFDGIRYPNDEEVDEDLSIGTRPETYSYIAFEPGQIKIVMNKPNATVAKTYEQTVAALVDRLNDSTDLEGLKDHVKEMIEDGQLGVRHMTNAELEEEWGSLFSEALTLTDPHNNPNSEPATPIEYAAMRRTLKRALEWLEQAARSRPDDAGLAEIVQSIRAVSTTSLSQMNAAAHLRATARLRPETVPLRSESAQRRLEEIEERLKALGFAMEYDAGAMPGEDPLKWLSTDEPVDPDEEGVPQEALDLALEWSTIIDADPLPSERTADDRPGHVTDSPHDVLMGAAQGVRPRIDPGLHEYVVQALMNARSCLEIVHDLKLPGLRGQLVQTVLEAVRETLCAAEESVRRIEAWRKAGASPEELVAIAEAGGYAAILDNPGAQTRFQDMLDQCVHSRLLEMREAFCDAGWSGTPSPLALKASGPVYEPLRKEDAGRSLVLAHRLTPNSGASDKVVALTFEIVDINNNPDSAGFPSVLSVRDNLTASASVTVRKILDQLEAALRSRGIDVDDATPDDLVPV